MVKVEAVRIDESPPAPLFTLIVGPSDQTKEVGQTKKEIAERYGVRKRWWTTLIERSVSVNKLHAHITPGQYQWIGTRLVARHRDDPSLSSHLPSKNLSTKWRGGVVVDARATRCPAVPPKQIGGDAGFVQTHEVGDIPGRRRRVPRDPRGRDVRPIVFGRADRFF